MIPAIIIEHGEKRSVFTPTGQYPWTFPPHVRQADHAVRVDGDIMREIVARDADTADELQDVLETLWHSGEHVKAAHARNGSAVRVFMFA